MPNLRIISNFILSIVFLFFTGLSSIHAQDKKEMKAKKEIREKVDAASPRDSLLAKHYKSQHKEVRKRIRKSYKEARRNHGGKRDPWYKRLANRRKKKSRGKKRRK
jgi:hypothetical protein